MSRTKVTCFAFILLAAFLSHESFAATEEDFLGRWEIMIDDTGTTFNACWLEVSRSDGVLSGELLWRWGSVTPVKWVKVVDDELQINRPQRHERKLVDVIYRAILRYDRLVGKVEYPDGSVHHFWGRPALEPVNVAGTWDLTINIGDREMKRVLTLEQKKGKITGAYEGRESSRPIQDVKLDGNRLTFSFSFSPPDQDEMKINYHLNIRGDRLEGTSKVVDRGWEATVTGERRRQWGEPIQLFNGKDLNNWLPRDPRATSKWYVEDGVMVNTAPDVDLYTRQVFDDFKLHVEFKMDKGSNSGIYLRGRYEVQLLDDYGRGTESHGNGSVYSRISPTENASKPALEWQTFDITLIGRWLTVVLNGVTIIDNQHLDGITGGALNSFERDPGPTMVQGDHGRVWFRKVTVSPALK